MILKKTLLLILCLLSLPVLYGCTGGQNIEDGLFVISLAVDAAPDGMLTLTAKALSGSQDTPAAPQSDSGEPEEPEPGYIVISATAPSCLRALTLLSATLPRTMILSQLREVVLSRTLAESGAAQSILREIYAMYRASGDAIVVVTPGSAGQFIRNQRAVLGVRLSQYIDVLFSRLAAMDVIPSCAQLSTILSAMESSTCDALAVYAAGSDSENALALRGTAELDRLPGHLPRTSPGANEYLGAAVFSGGKMTGTLTGEEVGALSLITGAVSTRTFSIGGAQYKTNVKTRVSRHVKDGALSVRVRLNLTRVAGTNDLTAADIAAQIEQSISNLLAHLQSIGSDAAGFGALAIRAFPDIPSWQAANWSDVYRNAPVSVVAEVRVL